MTIRAIRTADTDRVVAAIKSQIHRMTLSIPTKKQLKKVPQEFAEKRIYMKSEEFLNDKDNLQMLDFGEKLGILRDKIKLSLSERNQTAKEEIVQGINGFTRIKKWLEVNPKMNFSEEQTFYTPEENEYNILRRFKIGNLSRQMKNVLGIK